MSELSTLEWYAAVVAQTHGIDTTIVVPGSASLGSVTEETATIEVEIDREEFEPNMSKHASLLRDLADELEGASGSDGGEADEAEDEDLDDLFALVDLMLAGSRDAPWSIDDDDAFFSPYQEQFEVTFEDVGINGDGGINGAGGVGGGGIDFDQMSFDVSDEFESELAESDSLFDFIEAVTSSSSSSGSDTL